MLLRDAEIGSICPETHQLHQRFQLDSYVFCVERRVAEMSSSATFLEMPLLYRCWRYETRPDEVVGSTGESVEDLSGLSEVSLRLVDELVAAPAD
jgi:hypothetical protein